jgi:hypothetical protein
MTHGSQPEMPMFLGSDFDDMDLPAFIFYGSHKEWAAYCAANPVQAIDTIPIPTPDDVATPDQSARSDI